jgi:N4-(beta-N-acetylglucosaminyl)-L-asparaginase
MNRRAACHALAQHGLIASAAGLAALGCSPSATRTSITTTSTNSAQNKALMANSTNSTRATDCTIISTWTHGMPANAAALPLLLRGASALDAVEAAARVVESECPDRSVGLGGMPDRDGIVTLDAAIMTDDNRAGSVVFVRGVAHPISLARMVMERTPHVMLAGDGAVQFARAQGVEILRDARSPQADAAWRAWLLEKKYEPQISVENHDTISILALDAQGHLAAASTTSGLAFKMHGRIADSPIIGAGIYVEPGVGGAVCTGLGEMVIRTLGAFVATDAMRRGATAQEACVEAIDRIVKKNGVDPKTYQVGMLTLKHDGTTGAYAVQTGFNYAIGRVHGDAISNTLHDANSLIPA